MSTLNVGHSSGGRGVVALAPPGHKWDVTVPVDCWVSVSAPAGGDAVERDFHHAWIVAGKTYTLLCPVALGPLFLSAVTTDRNGDSVPTQLTYVDGGLSGL